MYSQPCIALILSPKLAGLRSLVARACRVKKWTVHRTLPRRRSKTPAYHLLIVGYMLTSEKVRRFCNLPLSSCWPQKKKQPEPGFENRPKITPRKKKSQEPDFCTAKKKKGGVVESTLAFVPAFVCMLNYSLLTREPFPRF